MFLEKIKTWKEARSKAKRESAKSLVAKTDRGQLEVKTAKHVKETSARELGQWEAVYNGVSGLRPPQPDSALGTSIPSQRWSYNSLAGTDVPISSRLPAKKSQVDTRRRPTVLVHDVHDDFRGLHGRPLGSTGDEGLITRNGLLNQERGGPMDGLFVKQPKRLQSNTRLSLCPSANIYSPKLCDAHVGSDEASQSSSSIAPAIDDACDPSRAALLEGNISPFASRTDLSSMTKTRYTRPEQASSQSLLSTQPDGNGDRKGLGVLEDTPESLQSLAPYPQAELEETGSVTEHTSVTVPACLVGEAADPVGNGLRRGSYPAPLAALLPNKTRQVGRSQHMAKVTKSYWTSEWAKNLEHADRPELDNNLEDRPGSSGVRVDVVLPDLVRSVNEQKARYHVRKDSRWESSDGTHVKLRPQDICSEIYRTTTAMRSVSAPIVRRNHVQKRQRHVSLPVLDTNPVNQHQSITSSRYHPSRYSTSNKGPVSTAATERTRPSSSSPSYQQEPRRYANPDDMPLAERRRQLLAQHRTSTPYPPSATESKLSLPSSTIPSHSPCHRCAVQPTNSARLSRTAISSLSHDELLTIRQSQLHEVWNHTLLTSKSPETFSQDRMTVMLADKRMQMLRQGEMSMGARDRQAVLEGMMMLRPERMEELHRAQMRRMQKVADRGARLALTT